MISNAVRVINIPDKTKAKFFENVDIGDRLIFSTPLEGPGRRRGLYASKIRIDNIANDEYVYKTPNELDNILRRFELEEILDERT